MEEFSLRGSRFCFISQASVGVHIDSMNKKYICIECWVSCIKMYDEHSFW
jgi:hypothetical protein